MSQEVSELMMDTTETTGKILGIVENHRKELENCGEILKKVQDLSLPDVDAEHHESTARC